MSRASMLMVIGVLTAGISFAGIPLSFHPYILPIFGAVVFVIGFLMRSERVAASRQETAPQPPPHDISPIA